MLSNFNPNSLREVKRRLGVITQNILEKTSSTLKQSQRKATEAQEKLRIAELTLEEARARAAEADSSIQIAQCILDEGVLKVEDADWKLAAAEYRLGLYQNGLLDQTCDSLKDDFRCSIPPETLEEFIDCAHAIYREGLSICGFDTTPSPENVRRAFASVVEKSNEPGFQSHVVGKILRVPWTEKTGDQKKDGFELDCISHRSSSDSIRRIHLDTSSDSIRDGESLDPKHLEEVSGYADSDYPTKQADEELSEKLKLLCYTNADVPDLEHVETLSKISTRSYSKTENEERHDLFRNKEDMVSDQSCIKVENMEAAGYATYTETMTAEDFNGLLKCSALHKETAPKDQNGTETRRTANRIIELDEATTPVPSCSSLSSELSSLSLDVGLRSKTGRGITNDDMGFLSLPFTSALDTPHTSAQTSPRLGDLDSQNRAFLNSAEIPFLEFLEITSKHKLAVDKDGEESMHKPLVKYLQHNVEPIISVLQPLEIVAEMISQRAGTKMAGTLYTAHQTGNESKTPNSNSSYIGSSKKGLNEASGNISRGSGGGLSSNGNDKEDLDGSEIPPSNSRPSLRQLRGRKQFPCPLGKGDPGKYADCVRRKHQFPRLCRVKEHLKRTHNISVPRDCKTWESVFRFCFPDWGDRPVPAHDQSKSNISACIAMESSPQSQNLAERYLVLPTSGSPSNQSPPRPSSDTTMANALQGLEEMTSSYTMTPASDSLENTLDEWPEILRGLTNTDPTPEENGIDVQQDSLNLGSMHSQSLSLTSSYFNNPHSDAFTQYETSSARINPQKLSQETAMDTEIPYYVDPINQDIFNLIDPALPSFSDPTGSINVFQNQIPISSYQNGPPPPLLPSDAGTRIAPTAIGEFAHATSDLSIDETLSDVGSISRSDISYLFGSNTVNPRLVSATDRNTHLPSSNSTVIASTNPSELNFGPEQSNQPTDYQSDSTSVSSLIRRPIRVIHTTTELPRSTRQPTTKPDADFLPKYMLRIARKPAPKTEKFETKTPKKMLFNSIEEFTENFDNFLDLHFRDPPFSWDSWQFQNPMRETEMSDMESLEGELGFMLDASPEKRVAFFLVPKC